MRREGPDGIRPNKKKKKKKGGADGILPKRKKGKKERER